MQEFIFLLSMWLIGISVCAIIIYWMTSSAIESSKLAREVQEMKQMMQQLLNDKHNPVYIDASESEPRGVAYCPSCSSEIPSMNRQCPVCNYPQSNLFQTKGV
ncbi:hypothetical protein J40TS1_04400 [Paenibacillus montaniterrae]|uniref:Uncharacterized protein n=1 Tax=Paenibacillus montaniterrae TaxID=429341 RepID=A0A920CX03_9BACL|nr:hypothetical protein J40TS1_04400 [Paenibacillus montaniterrae]